MRFKVDKMSCNHCVHAVTNAIRELDPQAGVEVDLASGIVQVTGRVAPADAAAAITAEGYPAQLIEDRDVSGS
ncbi:MAG: cation transporter [Steroidobacteraceae bacterium]